MDRYGILLLVGLSSCSPVPLRTYHYVELKKSWSDARQYCRGKYSDLATFENAGEISRLRPTFESPCCSWIGLKDDTKSWREAMGNDTNSWRWSSTGETSRTGYRNWNQGEPNSRVNEYCAAMFSSGKWNDLSCEAKSSFICSSVTEQQKKTFTFISDRRTWTSAQAYCRERHADLPTIETVAENNEVLSAKPAHSGVWIGLYRVPWTWSDQTQSLFRNWKYGSPNNYMGNQFCIAEDAQHQWDDSNCAVKLPFICHQVSKFKNTMRTKIQTDADLTDPVARDQILQQLGAELRSLKGWTDVRLQWKIQPRREQPPTPF